jgi:two-component system sensor histidine kinase TctE
VTASAQPVRSWSLSRRLAWRLTALMLCAMLLAAAAVARGTIATLRDLDDSALQRQARLVANHLPPQGEDGAALILPDEITQPFRASDGDNLFIVYGTGQTLLATSDPAKAAQAAPYVPAPLTGGIFRVPFVAGHRHGMIGFALRRGERWVVVLQGREQAAVLLQSLLASFLATSIWLLLPIGLATVVVSLLTLRTGLRPLLRVSAAAASVGPARPGVRLPTAGLPREVSPLVHAVNEALTRLEQTIETQRTFMAEAAHGLRTPLAVLTARLDALGQTPEADALRHDADRMARLVGQLLRMARLDSLPLDVTQAVDLHAVAVEAITALVPLGLRRDVELALLGYDGTLLVSGNHAALVLALANLIENAIAYAPPGSAVEVVVTAPATISVLDSGPGIAVEHRDRLLRPFERGIAAADGGAGLGLAIASRIAAAHGGHIHVDSSPTGGALVALDANSSLPG